MDPIKVDFTGKGKGSAIRKPKNAALKILISLLGTVVGAVIAYYFMLPPINLKSYDFYIYAAFIVLLFIVFLLLTSGVVASPDYTPYAKRLAVAPVCVLLVGALVVGVCFLASCVFFRAESYSKIISVDESKTFEDDVQEADFQSVPVLDTNAAAALAKRTLGDLSDQVSQFEVGDSFTQINYKGNPIKLTTLQYGDIFKWFKNTKNGFPGYITVNMVTQKAEFVRTDDAGLGYGNIRYSTYEHFNKYLMRHVRFERPTYLLGTPTFEIDETGYPFWLVPVEDRTVGVFGGTDVIGVLLVDAVTGEITEYTVDEVRENSELQWIDGIFSASLLVKQYNYYGKYSGGFWNSIIGQSGVKLATEGHNYLAINDDVYMYTGVTSTGEDQAIIGFVLVNMRTKEANYYMVSGAKENSAKESAEGALQNFKYTATFPLLLNISGQPTYFMSMLDAVSLVKMYAMVNVTNYRVVVTGSDIASTIEAYVAELEENNISIDIDIDDIQHDIESSTNEEETVDPDKYTTWTGSVTDIRTAVINGNSYYYLAIDSADAYFSIKADDAQEVIILNVGDTVSFKTTKDKGAIIEIAVFG